MKLFFDIESLKLDKQFLCVVFGEYGNYCLLFFEITLNFLKKNMFANLLTRCNDACIITSYLFVYYLFEKPDSYSIVIFIMKYNIFVSST